MSSGDPKTRTRILEATWRLMVGRNGRGVRMRDVAEEAGVSRQAVYDHFGSRADLMVATARYGDEVRGLEGRLVGYRAASGGMLWSLLSIGNWENLTLERGWPVGLYVARMKEVTKRTFVRGGP